MCRNIAGLILLALILAAPVVANVVDPNMPGVIDINDVNEPAPIDTLIGLADVNVVDNAIISVRYDDVNYMVADGDLTSGETTRWYVDANEVETLWVEGDPAPAATVSGTSSVKEGDVASHADNFLLALDGAANISSIDGINFQETIFPTSSNTFILFERGGNDTGSWQAIFADGTLGDAIAFDKASNGGPYAKTAFKAAGQNAYGVVFKTVEPAIGVRLTASGHDTLSISIPTPPAYLTGLADVNVVEDTIVSLSYGNTDYVVANGDLTLGTTTRWYVDANEVEIPWLEGDPAPAATVNGTSSVKAGDVGSHADNFLFAEEGANISSIDGINFQETLFPTSSNTFFLFERGGNDKGSWQAIFADGTLGDPVAFEKASNGGPYAKTEFKAAGQSAYGVVFKIKEPAIGVRIAASGHDALSISIPTPEAYLTGLADVNVVDDAIVSFRYDDAEYMVANEDLTLGTTTRWYVDANEVEMLWVEGEPAPAATVTGTSSVKEGDVGSHADNFLLAVEGTADMSSIDGINFQETLFAAPSDTFFLLERGGNDRGSWQAILADGSLGEAVPFDKASNGGPYAKTAFKAAGQSAYGVVFKIKAVAIGVRITASGHDALSISIPTPEWGE